MDTFNCRSSLINVQLVNQLASELKAVRESGIDSVQASFITWKPHGQRPTRKTRTKKAHHNARQC